jgi:hypothetical protein
MIRTMKKALEYAMGKSENPVKIKEYMEEYFTHDRGRSSLQIQMEGSCPATISILFRAYLSTTAKSITSTRQGGELELEYYNR